MIVTEKQKTAVQRVTEPSGRASDARDKAVIALLDHPCCPNMDDYLISERLREAADHFRSFEFLQMPAPDEMFDVYERWVVAGDEKFDVYGRWVIAREEFIEALIDDPVVRTLCPSAVKHLRDAHGCYMAVLERSARLSFDIMNSDLAS